EQRRMGRDGVGDAFAADEARADELVGVGAVGLGAGRAAGGAAGLARHPQHAVGIVPGGVAVEQGAGGAVVVFDLAAEVDGLAAAAGVADLGCPAVVVVPVETLDHAGDGVRACVGCGQDGDLLSLVRVWGWPPTWRVSWRMYGQAGGAARYAPWLSMPVPSQSVHRSPSECKPVPLQVQQR